MSYEMKKKNILCYGDSNTWAYDAVHAGRFEYEDRWCGKILQDALGDDYRVYEAGFGGRTTVFDDPLWAHANGFTDFPTALGTNYPLDLVIIMLGTNDAKIHLRQEAYSIEKGMERLVREALTPNAMIPKENIPKVLVVSPAAIIRDNTIEAPAEDFDERSCRLIAELPARYEAMAKRNGVEFFDAATVAAPCKYDGVHLDSESHKKLGLAIAEKVKEMLG